MRIGIDPGVTGAVAFLSDGMKFLAVFDIPTMANGKHQQINPYEMARMLSATKVKHSRAGETVHVFLEQVSAMPKQGVSSTFGFGVSFGIIQGVIGTLRIPMTLVTPQKWKKSAGLLRAEKDQARTLALRMYPTAELALKKDIGRADAILIARFGV